MIGLDPMTVGAERLNVVTESVDDVETEPFTHLGVPFLVPSSVDVIELQNTDVVVPAMGAAATEDGECFFPEFVVPDFLPLPIEVPVGLTVFTEDYADAILAPVLQPVRGLGLSVEGVEGFLLPASLALLHTYDCSTEKRVEEGGP